MLSICVRVAVNDINREQCVMRHNNQNYEQSCLLGAQNTKSRSRYGNGLDVYIPARDKGPITDYPQTRFKFISRPERRRSLPDKMWGRPGKRGHIYFVSPRLAPPRPLPRSGNVPKWQNICPGSLPVCSDLRTLATHKSGLTFKLESRMLFS